MNDANTKIVRLNEFVTECKMNIEELARRENVHQGMVRRLEGEIGRVQEERDGLVGEKNRLSKAIQAIYCVSVEVKDV